MTDDLRDIDPIIVETVLENADAFLDMDARVDEIVAWGEQELNSRRERLKVSNGTLEDVKREAAEIEAAVAQKLKDLETDVRSRYPEKDE